MKKHLIILFLLLFAPIMLILQAQTGRFYSAGKDLSNSLINKVYQDSKGFIWVATEDGLNKFDGYKFTIYKHLDNDKSSLLDNNVCTLFEDSSKRLWVGYGSGVQCYNRYTDSFDSVDILLDGKIIRQHVTAIIERKNGDIWIATSGEGLFVMRKGSKKLQFIFEKPFYQKTKCHLINVLFEDTKENLWLGTEDRGVFCYQPESKKVRNYCSPDGLTSEAISTLCEDNQGNIFVGTLTEGLNMLRVGTDKFIPVEYNNSIRLKITALWVDKQNKLYIGTDGDGLMELNRSRNIIVDSEISISSFDFSKAKIHSIIEDKNHGLWLGLYQKGIVFIPSNSNKFEYYGYKSIRKNTIGSSCVQTVYTDHDGITWVGTDNDGLYAINSNGNFLKHFSQRNGQLSMPSTVMCILEDSNNELWLGSYFDGLANVNKMTGKCDYISEIKAKKEGVESERVYCLLEDNSKNLWIGTYGAGLYKMNLRTRKVTRYPSNKGTDTDWRNDELPNNRVNALIQDQSGLIWIATSGGLGCFSPLKNTFINYFGTSNMLPGYLVFTLLEGEKDQIWVGTYKGLFCFNKKTKTFARFTKNDGLPDDVICGLSKDENGNLWISTHQGISKFVVKQKRFVNYSESDGLQGNEFTRGANFKDKNGKMFFPGPGGITTFYPKNITEEKKDLNVIIVDLFLYNHQVRGGDKSNGKLITKKPITDTDEILLAYNENTFTFELSTLEFTTSERIYYQYMIEELSHVWMNTRPGVNNVTYTNLPPGKFTFKVRACDHNNISAARIVTVIISPPWYQTWWAICLWLFLVIIVVYTIVMYLISRVRHQQEKIKREQRDQMNEAKLQFFINISHEIRTPMTLIISPLEKLLGEKSEKYPVYSVMYRNAQRILRLINQLMDVRKIEKGQMQLHFRETDIIGFIKDLMQAFDYQANKRNITFSFLHLDEKLKVWIDLNNFDKVLLNILSNAFKYTPDNGQIEISLSVGHNDNSAIQLKEYFEISIADTGIGIDKDKVEQIFERFYQINNSLTESSFGTGIGLHLSRSIVGLHHGFMKAENRSDMQGSRFIIRLPLGCEHLDNKELERTTDICSSPVNLIQEELVDGASLEFSSKELFKVKNKSKYHVLIVEDENDIRQYIKEELSNDFRVSECENGKTALEFVLKEKPDLVISDIMMPGMDGITLCHKIKQNINIYSIPVILLTAKNRTEDQLEGLDIGADAYIMKPFNITLLVSTVNNLITNRVRIKSKSAGEKQVEENITKIEMKSNDEVLMEKTIKIINEHVSDSALNVEMLAENIGMSRAHLHRKLKELTGQSTGDFIRSVRLKAAAALLSEKNFTVSEVAYKTGFVNMSHFSNAFKLFYGVSPKEYAVIHSMQQKPKDLRHGSLTDE